MDLESGSPPAQQKAEPTTSGDLEVLGGSHTAEALNGNGHPAAETQPVSTPTPEPSAESTSSEPAADPPAETPKADVAEPSAREEDDEPERSAIAEWVTTILLLLFGTTLLVQAFVIPTGSMKDTLLIGDHLLVDKLAYAPSGGLSRFILPYRPIKRGDIIVFRYPLDVSQTYVKRVIGLPGDHVKIINRVVWINGKEMKEPYAVHRQEHIDYYKHFFPSDPAHYLRPEARSMLEQFWDHNTGELNVPPDSYFAMGDNRDESDDSRFWGFVPRQNIIGKPLVVYWSFDATTEALQDPSLSFAHLKDVVVNFFGKTRWKRTFMLIRGYPLE